MASFFGHAVLGFSTAKLSTRKVIMKTVLLCMACTVIPDADFVGFKMGVPYDSTFGHRGVSHSILFAVFLAFILKSIFYRKEKLSSKKGWYLVLLFFICTVSHGLLDSLTNGGLGVAYFAPFSNERYFFPWQPIQVSPLSVGTFFTERGLAVIKSEAIWIGIPSLVLLTLRFGINKMKNQEDIENKD